MAAGTKYMKIGQDGISCRVVISNQPAGSAKGPTLAAGTKVGVGQHCQLIQSNICESHSTRAVGRNPALDPFQSCATPYKQAKYRFCSLLGLASQEPPHKDGREPTKMCLPTRPVRFTASWKQANSVQMVPWVVVLPHTPASSGTSGRPCMLG